MARRNDTRPATPEGISPYAEPTAEIAARVHRRLAIMGMVVLAMPLAYVIGLFVAKSQPMTLADCLPPGVTLQTPLPPGGEGATVGQALERVGARVVNGTLVDAQGVPIAFATPGDGPADPKKEGMKKAFRVITIPKFAPGSGPQGS
jgi:hypothetical protein